MSGHDPRDDYDDLRERGPLARLESVRWPADTMWCLGLLQFCVVQAWMVFVIFLITLAIMGNSFAEMRDELIREPIFWVHVLGWPIATWAAVIVVRGGNDLRQFRRYPWVVGAAIITLPLGVWFLAVLLRRDVRARFEAVARARVNASDNEASGAA